MEKHTIYFVHQKWYVIILIIAQKNLLVELVFFSITNTI